MSIGTRDIRHDFDVRRITNPGTNPNIQQLFSANPDRFGLIFITSQMSGWDVMWYSMDVGHNRFRINANLHLRFNFRDDGPMVCDQWFGQLFGVNSPLTIIETVYKPRR